MGFSFPNVTLRGSIFSLVNTRETYHPPPKPSDALFEIKLMSAQHDVEI
jgi:hypothetical protein